MPCIGRHRMRDLFLCISLSAGTGIAAIAALPRIKRDFSPEMVWKRVLRNIWWILLIRSTSRFPGTRDRSWHYGHWSHTCIRRITAWGARILPTFTFWPIPTPLVTVVWPLLPTRKEAPRQQITVTPVTGPRTAYLTPLTKLKRRRPMLVVVFTTKAVYIPVACRDGPKH